MVMNILNESLPSDLMITYILVDHQLFNLDNNHRSLASTLHSWWAANALEPLDGATCRLRC